MRIAVFTELYSPSVGGQETFFSGLAQAMTNRGHQVEIYCIGHEIGLAQSEVCEGVKIYRFPIAKSYKAPRIRFLRRDWVSILRYAWQVRKISLSSDHAFFLLNQWPLLHVLALPAAGRRKSLLHWCEVRQSVLFKLVQTWFPRLVLLNGAISGHVAAQISAFSGIPKIVTLPAGIFVPKVELIPRADRRDIVVIGRVAAHKNLPLVLETFQILRENGYKGKLRIFGDGPAMPELLKFKQASTVANWIEINGFVSDCQKFEALAKAEILAVPSRREGFPNVVAEALAFGLPVITADYESNGTKDVVRSLDIGIVTATTASAFADGFNQVFAKWEHFSSKALIAAGTLDWKLIAEKLEFEIDLALGPRQP
jgi:glycosyltransferase involved in cell wall biosynthesis